MLEFKKSCPICQADQFYSTEKALKVAVKCERQCRSCRQIGNKNPMYGKPVSESTREKLRIVHTGRFVSEETRNKLSIAMKNSNHPMFVSGENHPNRGIKWSQQSRDKFSQSKKGKKLSTQHRKNIGQAGIGRKHSAETRRKMRLAKIQHIIKNGGIRPANNIRAFAYFNKLELERGWNGFYASKNAEHFIAKLGYFLDYFEPVQNIVIEYDERKHYYADGSLKEKCLHRMNEIIAELGCQFFRYNETTGQLKQYDVR